MENVTCPYCDASAELVKGNVIYPYREDLYHLNFYLCRHYSHEPAYVGCHKGTSVPLGRLADTELRQWKSAAHRAFDPIWRPKLGEKQMSRKKAYAWLARQLNIPKKECHIGMFDITLCAQTVKHSMKLRR